MAALLVLLAVSPARGEQETPPAPAPSDRVVTAEAPIVAGNAASAKQRALNDAFRQVVERSLASLLAESGTAAAPSGLGPLKADLPTRARRFVRSYRVIEQGESVGVFRVQLEVEVDEALLRREVDRGRPAPSSTAPARPPLTVVKTGLAPLDAQAAQAVAAALGGVGLASRLEAEPVVELDDAKVRLLAGRSGGRAIVAVVASQTAEGAVRGAGVVATQCRMGIRIFLGGGGAAVAEYSATERAFAPTADKATADCLARVAASVAGQASAALPTSGGAGTDVRALTLVLNLVEPAALGPVLRALRKIGAVSSSEVRRIVVGQVELRVLTRATPPALVVALTRELGGVLDITLSGSTADTLTLGVQFPGVMP